MTKLNSAIQLVEAHNGLSQRELVGLMVSELKFSKAMAYTYFGLVKKRIDQKPIDLLADVPVQRRVASKAFKPLHSFPHISQMSFEESDIPAFLKR